MLNICCTKRMLSFGSAITVKPPSVPETTRFVLSPVNAIDATPTPDSPWSSHT